jgi:hypothetical protein
MLSPDISSWIDDEGNNRVYDHRQDFYLNPNDPFDKIKIYENQVNGWFLDRATRFLRGEKNGFIVLMICISYLEGVEQYRQGRSSHRNSRNFFIQAVERIYPGKFATPDLERLYSEVRCGLFHNGMVNGDVIINKEFPNALVFDGTNIKINPRLLLEDIKNDFSSFTEELKTDNSVRIRFGQMFSVLP